MIILDSSIVVSYQCEKCGEDLGGQLYGPYDAKYQGVLRSIVVDGKQYWGGGWSWRKAEAAMCQVLNATIQEQAIA